MLIRSATGADAQGMSDVLNPIIAAGGTTAYQTPRDAAAMRSMVLGPGVVCAHVALDDEERIAGMQWIRRVADEADVGSIATFARLAPKAPGVGTALWAETRIAAAAAGLREIEATIRADNVAGLAYYGRMGFVDRSVAHGVPLTDGTPVDRISKRYAL